MVWLPIKMLEAVVAKAEVSTGEPPGAQAADTAFEALTAHEAVPNKLPVNPLDALTVEAVIAVAEVILATVSLSVAASNLIPVLALTC
jgi:hypothetical protein